MTDTTGELPKVQTPPEAKPPQETPTSASADFLQSQSDLVSKIALAAKDTFKTEAFGLFASFAIPWGLAYANYWPSSLHQFNPSSLQAMFDKAGAIGGEIAKNLPAPVLEKIGEAVKFVQNVPKVPVGLGVAGAGAYAGKKVLEADTQRMAQVPRWAKVLQAAGRGTELGVVAATILNPPMALLYPVAKGFSIASTFLVNYMAHK